MKRIKWKSFRILFSSYRIYAMVKWIKLRAVPKIELNRVHIKSRFLIITLYHITVLMLSILIVQLICVYKAQQRTHGTFSPVCFLSAPAVLNDVNLHQVVLSSSIIWECGDRLMLFGLSLVVLIHFSFPISNMQKHSRHIIWTSVLFPFLTTQPHIRETLCLMDPVYVVVTSI